MSEGGGNKISVVFCYRSSKKDEIKTYLPVKERLRENQIALWLKWRHIDVGNSLYGINKFRI